MSFDKKNIEKAILNYQRKMDKGSTREPRRKLKKPEKQTEKEVLEWAKSNNLFLHVVDSSTWNPRSGSHGVSKAQVGFPDIVGNDLEGRILYIELKAKDRRAALSLAQRVFLEDKISQNCFAVVVDSVDKLSQYWKEYLRLKTPSAQMSYLQDCLPKQRSRSNEDDDLF